MENLQQQPTQRPQFPRKQHQASCPDLLAEFDDMALVGVRLQIEANMGMRQRVEELECLQRSRRCSG